MSLQTLFTRANSVQELMQWFIDIYNHLSKENYQNSDWVPAISNLTGSPDITGKYTRWGQQVDFTVVIDGTFITTGSVIGNLPFKATDYGIVSIYPSSVGYIKINTKEAYLPDLNISSETVVISGRYRVSGI